VQGRDVLAEGSQLVGVDGTGCEQRAELLAGVELRMRTAYSTGGPSPSTRGASTGPRWR